MADETPNTSPESVPALSGDLRRHPRHLCVDAGVLRLAIRPEFRGRRGLLLDLSAGGIGFLLEEALEAGTVLAFELEGPDDVRPMARIARVRYSRPHPIPKEAPWLPPATSLNTFYRRIFGRAAPAPSGSAWLIGCEFDRPLSDDEIKRVIAQLQADDDDL